MKIVFISNYFNHHQKPFSESMYKMLGNGYSFIETQSMPTFRKRLGYQNEEFPSYVIPAEFTLIHFDKILQIINEADAVIVGDAEDKYIAERKKHKKLLIKYSERLFKNDLNLLKYIPQRLKLRKSNKGENIYMLCAGAFVSEDYRKFSLFKDRAFKWGYFPEMKTYENIDELIEKKEKHSLLWVGRFIDWKHPEACIEVARRLKDDGYDFSFYFAGVGKKTALGNLARAYGVREHFTDFGGISPSEVRNKMENCEIFLFTSDKHEGWGVVLNEAMNSACAVVASDAAGSTGYLINHNENGLVYESGNIDELYKHVKSIFDNDEKRKALSKNAYRTIVDTWNAESSANRLVKIIENILKKESTDLFKNGPCSKA